MTGIHTSFSGNILTYMHTIHFKLLNFHVYITTSIIFNVFLNQLEALSLTYKLNTTRTVHVIMQYIPSTTASI